MESDSEVIPELEPEMEKAPRDAEPLPEPIVPADVHVELPFPFLIGTHGPLVLVAKIIENRTLSVAALDVANQGNLVAECGCPLTNPPPGIEMAQHWTRLIQALAQELVRRIKAAEKQSIIVPDRSVVNIGDL